MMTTREALEAALVQNPDDTTLHAVYADWLIEQNDPRGEYIRLSMLAEDRNQPLEQLRAIDQAMFDLRREYETDWLGPLQRFVEMETGANPSRIDAMKPNVSITWRRGWIEAIRIGQLNNELVFAMADCPLTLLLRELSIQNNLPENPTELQQSGSESGEDSGPFESVQPHLDLLPLLAAGRFRNLQVFNLGSYSDGIMASGWQLEEYLAESSQLREVRICCGQFSSSFLFGGDFPHLEILHVSGNQHRLPIALLGENDRLTNLQQLFLDTMSFRYLGSDTIPEPLGLEDRDYRALQRPRCMPALEAFTLRDFTVGDEGLGLLLQAPFFSRLKRLDLSNCNLSDEGAELLARHPHTPKLKSLFLDWNQISPIGREALENLGFSIGEQRFGLTPGEVGYFDFVLDAEEDDSSSGAPTP